MQNAAKSILEKSRALEIDKKIISIKELLILLKMIKVDTLITILKKNNCDFYIRVPDSVLKELSSYLKEKTKELFDCNK